MSKDEFYIVFFEVFHEEENAIKKYLPDNVKAKFYKGTIQEEKPPQPGSRIISIRTQSIVPLEWTQSISALLTRSTGYDPVKHLINDIELGCLPTYCSRSVAGHAMLMWTCLLKKLPQQPIENLNKPLSSRNILSTMENLNGVSSKKIIAYQLIIPTINPYTLPTTSLS
ncbi:MAG: hypothetical protein O7D86_09015 [Proteobacteria bacterium]|nr:hypothetical protein [Pseudomonadota bacterium]